MVIVDDVVEEIDPGIRDNCSLEKVRVCGDGDGSGVVPGA